ncbi:hypothetical protein [Clostridium perfringens]|uniref:hypothetical protein n=1 Tax=Clostridium perfringens TaxID=1502 RepID=UPI0010943AB4|nr:hypothetical protein [Clostridium perfringens]TGY43045.1 hypothetical protein E5346_13115 [Clostridium perfringens]
MMKFCFVKEGNFIGFQNKLFDLSNLDLSFFKKEFLPGIYYIKNPFYTKVILENYTDRITIYRNFQKIFENFNNEFEKLLETMTDDEKKNEEFGIINTDNIVNGFDMGGGGSRCCLYNYFHLLGLKPDFYGDEYVFNNNSRMMYTSSINEEMKKICLNSSCGNFFKVNGKSFVDDENYIPDLGLEVYKYKGKYFVTSDGNHRLCALKKIKSKKAKAKIINLENRSRKSYFDEEVEKLHKKQLGTYNINEYTFPYSIKIYSNEMASKILKDYYLKMNNLNINEEEAREFLKGKNELNDLVKLIENKNKKSFKELYLFYKDKNKN